MQKKTIGVLLFVITVLFDVGLVWSQAPSDRQNKFWKAEWITAPDVPQRDESVLHFKKVIELSEPPPHFYVDVSADNQFVFHVNEQLLGNGPTFTGVR